MKDIVIIGAGYGGLAASALLAKEGHKVTVIEKNEQPGGRASLMEKEGFTFDMGPSWYMWPQVFDDFFSDLSDSFDLSDLFLGLEIACSSRILYIKSCFDSLEAPLI